VVTLTGLLLVLGAGAGALGRGVGPPLPRPHATLLASEPAADTLLRESPARIRLLFSEPIESKLSRLELVDATGSRARLSPTSDAHDVHALVAPVSHLGAGRYEVVWRVVSADGHPVSGAFAFTVGEGAAPSATVPPAANRGAAPDSLIAPAVAGPTVWGAPVAAAILRGMALACLMALAGLLALGEWILPNVVRPRLMIGLAVAAVVLIAAHATAWAINAADDRQFGAGALSALLGSGTGRRELARVALAVLSLWAIGLARRPGAAACFAIIALLVSGDVGHSAAIHPALAVPAKALHLLGGALWLGGLLWIAVADRELPRYPDGVRRISSLALTAAVVVAASGVAQMALFLPSARAVVQSPYGLLAVAKIAGLAVLIVFGAYHRYRVLPRTTVSPSAAVGLQTSVRAEAGVMVLVILLGGLLAYVPPVPS
jgi:copper transport protein